MRVLKVETGVGGITLMYSIAYSVASRFDRPQTHETETATFNYVLTGRAASVN